MLVSHCHPSNSDKQKHYYHGHAMNGLIQLFVIINIRFFFKKIFLFSHRYWEGKRRDRWEGQVKQGKAKQKYLHSPKYSAKDTRYEVMSYIEIVIANYPALRELEAFLLPLLPLAWSQKSNPCALGCQDISTMLPDLSI